MILAIPLGLALALPPGVTAAAQSPPVSLPVARAMSTAELAARVLPPEIAAQVVGHMIDEGVDGASFGVRFYMPTEQIAPTICRRRTVYASSSSFNSPRTGERSRWSNRGTQIALSADCAKVQPDRFAFVQPERLEDGAVKALQWIADVQQRTRRERKLVVPVRCRSVRTPDPCTAGALAVFAGLPLDKTYIIDKGVDAGGAERWRLAVMPTGPGQLFFQTMLTGSADKPEIELTWDAPAPF